MTLIKLNGEWKKVDADSFPVTEIPASADVGTTLLYTGETTASYITGHAYQYQQTSLEPVSYDWVDISMNGVQPLFQIDLDGADPSNYTDGKIYQALTDGATLDDVTVTKGHFYIAQENESSGNWEWVEVSDKSVVDQTYNASSTNAQSGKAVASAISNKVDKVTGKGLSTNDFTDALKNKLDGIETGAEANTITGIKGDNELFYRTGDVNLTKGDIGLGNVGNFKAVSTLASQGLSNTEKSNARANIGAGTSSFSGSYNDLTDKPEIPSGSSESVSISLRPKLSGTWSTKTWTGLTNFTGNNVWTDGTNIYYSSGTTQYVLNKETGTWSTKTWTGLTDFTGNNVWTDGTNIYYSNSNNQYVLNKKTSAWSTKTWTGLTSFNGNSIWTDGTNIYYSYSTTQYVLSKATGRWSVKAWSGLTDFNGVNVWTDGINIYFSSGTNQYVLDKATSKWSTKTWTGLTSFYGNSVWTDGTNIYYSNSNNQYVLNKETSKWSTKTWTGLTSLTSFIGSYIWTDGTDVYFSQASTQYALDKILSVRT